MLDIFIYTYIFLIGLAIGSFLNVVIYRLPIGEGIVIRPSHCMKCENKIKFYDLIPVLSYIFLRGKCRYCGEKISIQYAAVELLTALSFVGIYYRLGWAAPIETIASMVLISMFIAIFFIDLYHYIIPDEIIIFGLITGLIFSILKGFNFNNLSLYNWSFLTDSFLGAIIGIAAFIGIYILGLWMMKAEAMGMGDVKLMGVVGLYVGFKLTVLSMFLSFIIGSVISLLLIAIRAKKMKDQIPFGPFIVLGSLIAALWGNQILTWYFSLSRV